MPILTKRANKIPLGIYVHVPFCRSKCQYCDFYSLCTKEDKIIDGYLDAVCDHIKEAGELAPGYKVDSIYFGGGTPSFFGADGMATIMTAIRRAFDVDSAAEITFEANPDSVSDKFLSRMRAEGFNRVSLGIQCDDDEILEKYKAVSPKAYPVRPPEDSIGEAVYQVVPFIERGTEDLFLSVMPGCTATRWSEYATDVTPKGNGKADGIRAALERYGLKAEETIAFGDGENDIPMLEIARIGVAMGNARQIVKDAADYVTLHVREDGVSAALRHFGLLE